MALYVFILLFVFAISLPITILNTHVSSFGIVLNFIQICALFNMFSLKWTDSLQTFFDLLSIFNLNIQLFRPECITRVGYFSKFMVMIFIPAIYFVFSFIPLTVSFLCFKWCKMPYFTRKRFVRLISWTINSWFASIILQGYIALSSWTLAFYSCDSYGKLLTNLDEDAQRSRHLWHSDEVCDSSNRAFGGYLFMFWVGLGVYVLGVPIATFILWYLLVGVSRWRARRQKNAQEKSHAQNTNDVLEMIGLGEKKSEPTDSVSPPTSPPISPEPVSPDSAPPVPEQEAAVLKRLTEEIKLSTTALLVEGRMTSQAIVQGGEARRDVIRMFGSFYHRYRYF